MTASYFIYDFETDGSDPRTCRPLQVAWQRTDLDLHPIEDPVSLLVQPAPDRLPHPKAIEITGISLKRCAAEGISDAEVFRRLHEQVTRPGTCSFGWNSRRFDNEVLRFGFWRNFMPAYDHEWTRGCDAWDLIDLARAACALRPDGVSWPTHDDGSPTFRLDQLAPANRFDHSDAHDALADVNATAHVARVLRQANGDLWSFGRSLADTETARSIASSNPFVHVTSRIAAAQWCTALFAKVAAVPGRRNEIIAWNLQQNPDDFVDADAESLRRLIFTRQSDLRDGEQRLGVKTIKLNAAPFVAPLAVLNEENLRRLSFDMDRIESHHAALQGRAKSLAVRLGDVFDPASAPRSDADDALYGGDFPSKADLAIGASVYETPPGDLHLLERRFRDPRFTGLLLHWIARNHPECLGDAQRSRWVERTRGRLESPVSRDDLPWTQWCIEMDAAISAAQGDGRLVLEAARDHGRRVAAAVGLTDSS